MRSHEPAIQAQDYPHAERQSANVAARNAEKGEVMAIEALEGLTDEQLFSEANADEAPADTAVAEPASEPAEQQGKHAMRQAGSPAKTPSLRHQRQPIRRHARR
jgi:hypothetical protein